MNIITIPLKHLRRKMLRTSLLMIVFAIGILSIVTLNYVSKAIGESLDKKLSKFGANILVYPLNDSLNISYGGFSLGNLSYDVKYLKEKETTENIRGISLNDRISAIAPKLVAVAKIGNRQLGVIGVDWKEEMKIKSDWNIIGKMPSKNNELLTGLRAAQQNELAEGAKITIAGKEFVVTGVIDETGSEDDNMVFADLRHLQEVTGKKDLVNFMEVAALCSGCPIEDIVNSISQKLPDADVKALQKVVKQRMYTVAFVEKLALIVSLVILLTACFMIALFMLASVNERKKEIGILRALGYSQWSIFSIFCFEALLVGIAAGSAGYLGGYLISFKVLDLLSVVDEVAIKFAFTHFAGTLLLVSVVSGLSSVIPALKAARIEPSEALIIL